MVDACRGGHRTAKAIASGSSLPQWGGALLLLAAGFAHADDRFERSREIAAEFQQDLGGKLKSAMAAGGPVNAIAVCAEAAPNIAERASAQSGAQVGRTALRVRNPGNAPDAQAAAVLRGFEVRLAAGAVPPVEHYVVHADGGARYMGAIVLQPLCATCHGESLAPAVADAIAAHYPEDAATGFRVGELRGAFIIDWPAEEVRP